MDNTLSAPRWDLSSIYPSLSSRAFKKDKKRLSDLSDSLKAMLDSSFTLGEVLPLVDEGCAIASNLSSYTLALVSVSPEDDEALIESDRVDQIISSWDSALLIFKSKIVGRKGEFSSCPEYSALLYRASIEGKHKMGKDEEELFSRLSLYSSGAFSSLQDALSGSLESAKGTLSSLRLLSSSPDRNVRKEAYEEEIRILRENRITFAYALNSIKGESLYVDKKRGWKDPYEKSLFNSALRKGTLNLLISALEEAVPLFGSYFEARRKLLHVDKLEWYDLHANLEDGRTYTFEEAEEIVTGAFSSYSDAMGALAKRAFSSGWIDGEVRKGKASGAYDTEFLKSGESRVFLNFDGSLDSVFTLAHELGHAYHDQVAFKKGKASLMRYPMTFAETASSYAEALLFEYMLENTSGKERIALLFYYASSLSDIVVDILSRYYFELEFFKKRGNGFVSPESISKIMKDAQERTYGDEVGEKHAYMWAVKSHYYSFEEPFYNYPYAFGLLLALSLRYIKLGADEYEGILSSWPEKDLETLLGKKGLFITTYDFWHRGVALIEKVLKELSDAL